MSKDLKTCLLFEIVLCVSYVLLMNLAYNIIINI